MLDMLSRLSTGPESGSAGPACAANKKRSESSFHAPDPTMARTVDYAPSQCLQQLLS